MIDGIVNAIGVRVSWKGASPRARGWPVSTNPMDSVRVLTLSFAGTPHVFGAAAEAWNLFLGGRAARR